MGYKVKEYRKSKGITQAELSKRSGVSRTIISALESSNPPSTTLKTLARLAAALDTTIENIFFGSGV